MKGIALLLLYFAPLSVLTFASKQELVDSLHLHQFVQKAGPLIHIKVAVHRHPSFGVRLPPNVQLNDRLNARTKFVPTTFQIIERGHATIDGELWFETPTDVQDFRKGLREVKRSLVGRRDVVVHSGWFGTWGSSQGAGSSKIPNITITVYSLGGCLILHFLNSRNSKSFMRLAKETSASVLETFKLE